jgi:hypothetical protein
VKHAQRIFFLFYFETKISFNDFFLILSEIHHLKRKESQQKTEPLSNDLIMVQKQKEIIPGAYQF